MKNIKAMGIAFIMFLVTITGVGIATKNGIPAYNIRYGTWISATKFGCNDGMKKLVDNDNVFAVFGSSELKHCQRSGFHADSIYKNSDIKPVFIGKGGFQSLGHAIILGSIGQVLKGKKVVISVSPQWFKSYGFRKDAFGSMYSETNMIAFLKNKEISDETKDYVIKRIKELTDENPTMWKNIRQDIKWYRDNNGNVIDTVRKNVHSALANYKADTKLYIASLVKGYSNDTNEGGKDRITHWNKLYKKAVKRGEKKSGHNRFGMSDRIYNKNYKEKVKKKAFKDLQYTSDSMEFDDLKCFIDICRQENIDVMMVMQPLNAKWADYTNFPKAKRDELYGAVRNFAKNNNVKLADLTSMEYDDYMFEDDSHLALKGLVYFNEQIYNFYKQDKK